MLETQNSNVTKSSQNDDSFDRRLSPLEQFELIPTNTIDERISETLSREFAGVCYKFSHVLIPRASGGGANKLRNWDLWGPFFMALLFVLFINNSQQFTVVFFSVLGGATVVTFNIRVIGGQISFFQSVSILGYCLFPLFLVVFIIQLFKFFQINNGSVRAILVVVSCFWCIIASRSFVAVNVPSDRKFVGMYPVCLFYVFIAVLLVYN